jgi:hypothetical protein
MLSPVKAPVKYLALAAIAALVSCAAPKGPTLAANSRCVVTALRTPFYRYGPAQATGADFVLMKGQVVTLLKRSFGYSQIMTADGTSGYVSTEDLGPAPAPTPTPKPKHVPIPESEYEQYLPPPERAPGESVQPRDLEPPRGLPDPEPTQPSFRY